MEDMKKMDSSENLNEDDFMIELGEEDAMEENDSLIGQTIHLVLDDGSEMDTVIIADFGVEEYPWTYIALLPITEESLEEDEGGEVFLYRIKIDENGDPILGAIESDEEYDRVSEAFYEEMSLLEEEAGFEEI